MTSLRNLRSKRLVAFAVLFALLLASAAYGVNAVVSHDPRDASAVPPSPPRQTLANFSVATGSRTDADRLDPSIVAAGLPTPDASSRRLDIPPQDGKAWLTYDDSKLCLSATSATGGTGAGCNDTDKSGTGFAFSVGSISEHGALVVGIVPDGVKTVDFVRKSGETLMSQAVSQNAYAAVLTEPADRVSYTLGGEQYSWPLALPR